MDMYFDAAFKGIEDAQAIINRINDNLQFDVIKKDLEYSLMAVAYQIGNIYGRICKSQHWEDMALSDKELLLAFVYLNNQLKHDKGLQAIHCNVGGSMYPRLYPMRYGEPSVAWSDFEDHGKSREARREYYDIHLNEKDIAPTLDKLSKLLHTIRATEICRGDLL